MSDPLDDFFAKKDAKKREKLLGHGESSKVKPEKAKKVEKNPTVAITIKPLDPNDDGEWKEIEDKTEDLDGLKIHSMTIKDKEEEIREQKEKDAVEYENRRDDLPGPWKVSDSENAEVDGDVVNQDVDPEVATITTEKKSSYVPPALRNKQANSSSPAPFRGSRRAAPEIENPEEFPSLGGVAAPRPQQQSATGASINLGNKFSALSNN